MTLLTTIQNAARLLAIPVPTTVVSNADENVARLLGCANQEGKELRKRHHWTVLEREHTFSTANGTAAYSLPSDFQSLIADTVWNRSDYWDVRGSLTPQEWQVYKSTLLGSGVINQRYRIKRGSGTTRQFFIDPTPTATESMVFEYRSTGFCASSGGTVQTAWAADDDVGILDESLIELGVIWRFLRAIGNDYATQLAEYESSVGISVAQDRVPSMRTYGRPVNFTAPVPRVPETGYGPA